MEIFEQIMVYIIMTCAVVGVIVSIVNKDHPLGKKFFEGLDCIGAIFLPVAAILASAPFLNEMITHCIGPLFASLGSDMSMAATTIIAVDMGGYELASAIAATKESWIMAMVTGYMAGATVVFSIPVALRILPLKDRKYLALGTISGFLAIPLGVFISCVFIAFSQPLIRSTVGTNLLETYRIALSFGLILKNLLPLIIISVVLFLLLKWKPKALVKGFLIFGNIMDYALRIIFVLAMIEYSTGLFSTVLGHWGFDPIMADSTNLYRAAEESCSIGIMLAGAFPFVYILQTYLKKPLAFIGRSFNLSVRATAGILAASANVIALLGIVKELTPEDKIKCIAYSVCAAFLFGDHLWFTDLYQPTLALPIMIGKFVGGCFGILFAAKIAVPIAKTLAKEELIKEGSSIQK